MGRVYRHVPQLGLADVAPDGRVRLDALARWLQDAAWADVVDSGIPDDGVWIVRRLQLQVTQFPRFGEQAIVETFCSGVAKLWAERTSRVTTDGGGAVEAVALWVHLDPTGNRPRPLPEGFDAVYGASAQGRRVKARLHHPAAPPPQATARAWRFRAAELDLAGHVNNAAYWQVLEEELVGNGTPDRATYEIEHRAPGTAGDATVLQADHLRWIATPDGTVLASLRADHHSTSSGASTTGTGAITEEAVKIGERLAREGVLGRFAVDFVVARDGAGWNTNAIELNLRKGGTTHPFLTLQFLTDGCYDAAAARFAAPGGREKHLVATDHLESERLRGLTVDDLFDVAVRHGLHFDPARQSGTVFHMMSPLTELGRVGVTAVGDSPAEADAEFERVEDVLLDEAAPPPEPALPPV